MSTNPAVPERESALDALLADAMPNASATASAPPQPRSPASSGHGTVKTLIAPSGHAPEEIALPALDPAEDVVAPVPDRVGPEVLVPDAAPGARATASATRVVPRRSPIRSVAAMLAGGVIGSVLGVAAGLALLALMDPPRWLERIVDPEALWTETTDPMARGSAIALVVGCALVGALIPLRGRSLSRS